MYKIIIFKQHRSVKFSVKRIFCEFMVCYLFLFFYNNLCYLVARKGTFSTSGLARVHSLTNMASGGVSVASLWTEVNRCGQNGDYTRALRALGKSKCCCWVCWSCQIVLICSNMAADSRPAVSMRLS